MTKPKFPILTVSQILDRRTVVLTGEVLEKLEEGDRLVIVSVGATVPNTTLRLVQKKAEVEVRLVTDEYVVAETGHQTEDVETKETEYGGGRGMLGLAGIGGTTTRTHTRSVRRERSPLTVNEKEVSGNPAARPVTVGDYVVRPESLRSFTTWISQERQDT